jgi:hypothetical protein
MFFFYIKKIVKVFYILPLYFNEVNHRREEKHVQNTTGYTCIEILAIVTRTSSAGDLFII